MTEKVDIHSWNGQEWKEINIGQPVSDKEYNNAIHHWLFYEGSNLIVADNIGNSHGSIEGASWIWGDYIEGWAIEGNGTDEYIETTTWNNFGSNLDTDFSVTLTVDNAGSGRSATINDGDNTTFGIHFGVREEGSIRLNFRSDNGNAIDVETGGGYINDGSPHRIVINKRGNSANDIGIYVDGQEVTSRLNETGDVSGDTFSNFEYPFTWFARNNRGTKDSFFDGIIDEPIIFNNSLNLTDINEDYNKQPWS